MNSINFNGKDYGTREITMRRLTSLTEDCFTIAPQSLWDALDNGNLPKKMITEAEAIDETIYFYVPDEDLFTLSGEQLCKYALDESYTFISEENPPFVKTERERELMFITAIIADNHLKYIYTKQQMGYIAGLELCGEVAIMFYDRFQAYLEDKNTQWDEVVDMLAATKTYLSGICAYDDLVMGWSKEYIKQYFTNPEKINL